MEHEEIAGEKCNFQSSSSYIFTLGLLQFLFLSLNVVKSFFFLFHCGYIPTTNKWFMYPYTIPCIGVRNFSTIGIYLCSCWSLCCPVDGNSRRNFWKKRLRASRWDVRKKINFYIQFYKENTLLAFHIVCRAFRGIIYITLYVAQSISCQPSCEIFLELDVWTFQIQDK